MRQLSLMAVLAFAGGALYAHGPDDMLPPEAVADRVVVFKGERTLVLMNDDQPLKQYSVALGREPLGAKVQEGDGRTPEGLYLIDWRKPDSAFHKALHVSYPNAEDLARPREPGVGPGGLIMLHGLRNGLGFLGRFHRLLDWTSGCIAVTDAEIDEIWRVVPDGTPIEIRP
jgi:murein L,D-transpeptidase YafK